MLLDVKVGKVIKKLIEGGMEGSVGIITKE